MDEFLMDEWMKNKTLNKFSLMKNKTLME